MTKENEIKKAAEFLKQQNFKEETNFSLYATAEQMVKWAERERAADLSDLFKPELNQKG